MKTQTSSFILGLLLVAMGCSRLDSPKQRAYRSLDTVIRLYEAGVDTIDADLLAPALSYFPSKGDAATNGRLWYHAGLISYHHGAYDKATRAMRFSAITTSISKKRWSRFIYPGTVIWKA